MERKAEGLKVDIVRWTKGDLGHLGEALAQAEGQWWLYRSHSHPIPRLAGCQERERSKHFLELAPRKIFRSSLWPPSGSHSDITVENTLSPIAKASQRSPVPRALSTAFPLKHLCLWSSLVLLLAWATETPFCRRWLLTQRLGTVKVLRINSRGALGP